MIIDFFKRRFLEAFGERHEVRTTHIPGDDLIKIYYEWRGTFYYMGCERELR